MKYSFLMPYIKRHKQLENTLFSFNHWYSNRQDWEIIIIEDQKNWDSEQDHNQLDLLCKKYSHLSVKKIGPVVGPTNPARHFNTGAKMAKGQFFILTNPECFHTTNILSAADEEFNKTFDKYIICACENRKNVNYGIKKMDQINGDHVMWYQHSRHRNVCYHFCSIISAKNFFRVGGFNEIYCDGLGFEDNDFRDSVKCAKIPFVVRDDLVVIHQWHIDQRPANWETLLKKNRKIYQNRSIRRGI
jgi:hypothetical protein